MTGNIATKRCLAILALLMIGEGAVGFLRPTRYALFWKMGPRKMRAVIDNFAANPGAVRIVAAGEMALGLCLALRSIEE